VGGWRRCSRNKQCYLWRDRLEGVGIRTATRVGQEKREARLLKRESWRNLNSTSLTGVFNV
jgi:hypothetical protein